MKTISKRFLKGGLAILLAFVMLFGTTLTGFAATIENADTRANVDLADTSYDITAGKNVYYLDTASWNACQMYIWKDSDGYNTYYTLSNIPNTKIYYYNFGSKWAGYSGFKFRSDTNWSKQSSGDIKRSITAHTYFYGTSTTASTTMANMNGTAKVVTMISSDNGATWTATANPNIYTTVSGYNVANGATSASAVSANTTSASSTSIEAAYGSTITYKATATGATFKGFSTSQKTSGTPSYTSTSTSYTRTASAYGTSDNTTVYAYYILSPTYSVTFDANGGSGAPSAVTNISSGGTANIPTTKPTMTGHTFKEWNTAADGSGTAYTAGGTISGVTANITLYAQYTKNTYTVKFFDINGNQIGSDQTVEHGATPTAPTAPAVEGKTFAGWTPTVGAVTGNTTYQATYTDNTYTITVKETDGKGTVTLGKTSAKYQDTVTLSVTPPTDMKISSITGGGLNVGECDSYNGSFTMLASNVTINIVYVAAGSCAPHFALGDQTLNLGATVTNTASTNEFCEGNRTFTYKSSDTSVATVNESTGVVTAKKPGTATITATCNCGTTRTYTVTVRTPSVSVAAMTLDVNATLKASPVISEGPASGYTITYSASSEYFTVTADGIVTAKKPGTGTVNFTMTYGGNTVATGSFSVTVKTPVFTIKPLSVNLIVGQTMTDAFVTSSTPAAQSVSLTSTSATVATISGNKVTAVGKGTTTISARFKYNDSYTAIATATVIVAEPDIAANPTSVALEFGEGATTTSKTVTIDTNAADGNGTGDTVTVTSANTNVATATLSGSTITITATGVGATTVTAKFHDAEVSIPVTVTKYDPYVYLYVTNNHDFTNLYIYSWQKANNNNNITPVNTSMIYIGVNGDGDKIFAYRFLKTNKPDNFIITKTGNWTGNWQTADIPVSWTDTDHKAFYFTNANNKTTMGDWTKDCMIVRPTVTVADVTVPVGGTETATATFDEGGNVYWTMADTTVATVADVTTATSTVTGVTPGETTISARVFVDTTKSSIKTLPTNYKTDTACWPFISEEGTATVTVGSVDYNITIGAEYSNNGKDYVAGTTGGTVTATVDGAQQGDSFTVAHGKVFTLTATANTGYRFAGWYSGDELVSTEASFEVTAKSIADYKAHFVKTHKITVNFSEGIELIKFNNIAYNESFDNITVDAGATVTVYASPAEGYSFDKWTAEGTTLANPNAVTITITDIQSSITLTASAIPTYTASATAQTNKYFGTYGGTVTIDGDASPKQYLLGETATFEAHPNTNYCFAGWYSDAEFTVLVSAESTYSEEMTEDGITLYALFVKQFYLTTSDNVQVAEFVYDIAKNEYKVTSEFLDHFTLTSNDAKDVTSADVEVVGGEHTGCTVAGHYTSYQVTPDTENYDIESPVTYTLTPDFNANGTADGTYTLNIALSDAEKVNISVDGEKVAEKPIGSKYSHTFTAPAGQYLLNVATTPAVEGTIVDNTFTFTVPAQGVDMVPTFADYSYVEFTDTTGLTITGLKSGYRAGEAVEITVAAASEQVSIVNLVADNDAAVLTNNGGTWTITIAAMPADTTITLTTTVDAKFKMDYGMTAIGNYGSGYTTYGTIAMNIGETTLAKGGYADKTETVTYTATPNTNFIFDGWYSDIACETSTLLSRETSYDVTPTADTTIYALFVPKHYIAEDQSKVTTNVEMTYNKETRTFHHSSSTMSKSAWFRVSNNKTTSAWTDSNSYAVFDSSFNVTFNANAYMVSVGWGTKCYALSSDATAEYPFEIIVEIHGNTSIDVSCQAARSGNSVWLSSGRLDLPGSYNSAVFEADITYTHEGATNPADVYVANEDENREKYKRLNLPEAQTVSFQVEITGTAKENYYVDKFVVYHIFTETYTIVDPVTLGNNTYSGSVFADGDCYIVPVYFITEEYAAANDLAQIDIYFDASAIKDQAWGPFVGCYAWGTGNVEYNGGWSGQMMIPTEDGLSFYTLVTVPSTTNTTAGSKPVGITFNNYTQSTVPGSNPGAFGISATQYQCYDYREPITLYENGFEVISFTVKDSSDGYHGDRGNGVTINTVTPSTTDIFNKYHFDYLYCRDNVTPMDLNGDAIENYVDIEVARADYYIVSKGDITYDPIGTKYEAHTDFDADWAVDWYVFDKNGKYVTKVLSDALYSDVNNDGTTLLLEKLGITPDDAAGKTVAITYEHENNANHQVSYDGQWYGNMLDHTITGNVLVGIVDNNKVYTIDDDNVADYGEGYAIDLDGTKQQTIEILLDLGEISLSAERKDGYRFVGWHTKQPDGSYKLISTAFDYTTYINNDTTYYAIFKEIQSGEVDINHAVYKNTDPAIPDHGGVSEMSIEVYDSKGNLVTKSTPSTSRSTASFEGTDTEVYTIRIITTPLMNGQFFAWYTDSLKADGTKTYEEVFTDDSVINSTKQVVAEFEYEYDTATSLKTINIYSDVRRVSNKANLYYKYRNRYGAIKTYTVKDIVLNDDECIGYIGNNYTKYCPTFRTLCTFMTPDGKEWTEYIDQDRIQEYTDNGYTLLESYNLIDDLAPNPDTTDAFGQNIQWVVTDTQLTTASSEITLVAKQDDMKFTVNYTAGDITDSATGYYNTLMEVTAPSTYNGAKFSYWYEPATDQILTYLPYYNYRIVENKTIVAVYGEELDAEWTPSVNSVTYTREFDDNGDYIYTDFLLAYNNVEGKKVSELEGDVEYGFLLVRDSKYYIDDSANVEYPDAGAFGASLEDVINGGKNKAFTVDGTTYNCYYYKLSTDLTNFNRCSAFLRYDNTKVVGGSHYYREYAFTAVAYIKIDGQIYLSSGLGVNFFDLGNIDATESEN